MSNVTGNSPLGLEPKPPEKNSIGDPEQFKNILMELNALSKEEKVGNQLEEVDSKPEVSAITKKGHRPLMQITYARFSDEALRSLYKDVQTAMRAL